MAKFFYTAAEGAAALLMSEEQFMDLVRDNNLRTYRDGPIVKYRLDHLEALKQKQAQKAQPAEATAQVPASTQDLLSAKDAGFLLELFDQTAELVKITDHPLYLPLQEVLLASREGAAPISSPTAQHKKCQILSGMPRDSYGFFVEKVSESRAKFPNGLSSKDLQSHCLEGAEVTLRLRSCRRKTSVEAVERLAMALQALNTVALLGVAEKTVERLNPPERRLASLEDVGRHIVTTLTQGFELSMEFVKLETVMSRLIAIIEKLETFVKVRNTAADSNPG